MWKQKIANSDKEQLLLKNGATKLVARLLSQRDVDIDDFKKFIDSKYEDLTDPYALNGVEEAVKIFIKNIKNKSKIAVSCDFDCDGVVSATMISELCRSLNVSCDVFVPSRFDHGYGLNSKTIYALKDKFKSPPDLLFVLDCGTNNFNEIKELKEWGVKEVIIIDHHLVASQENVSTNADALINWHLSTTNQEYCTCGEIFMFICGIAKKTSKVDPMEYLTYAALATLADSCEIFGDNRIIVKHGLGIYAISHVRASGLRALMNLSKVKTQFLTQTDVSFRIVPRLNAPGRMGNADLAYRLLTEYDITMADELACSVDQTNVERKQLQGFIESEAIQIVRKSSFKNSAFAKSEKFHIGINGIVASTLVEEFNVPSIVCAYYDGKLKGSGRSVEGISIKKIADTISYCFTRFGGHDGAIGVEIKKEYEESFAEIFDNACKNFINNIVEENKNDYYDACLKIDKVNEEIAEELIEKFAPYCRTSYNNEPVFKLKDVVAHNVNIKSGDTWRLIIFNVVSKDGCLKYDFKTFSDKFNSELEGQRINVYFKFPHSWDSNERFCQFTLDVVDIEKI